MGCVCRNIRMSLTGAGTGRYRRDGLYLETLSPRSAAGLHQRRRSDRLRIGGPGLEKPHLRHEVPQRVSFTRDASNKKAGKARSRNAK